MNRTQIAFALTLSLGLTLANGLQAQPTGSPAVKESLHRIEENARDARENAAIYQWKRVNFEVDRIVSAEKAVEKALGGKGVNTLHDAVSALRKARLDRNADAVKSSADSVMAAVEALNKASN
jgi:hypothetical protein